MHSTSNLEDEYIGSGKLLWLSIRKYGKENHIMEILEFCDSRRSLKEREREIVNEELLDNPLCMNLKRGGEGGLSTSEHITKYYEAGRQALHDKILKDDDFRLQITAEARKTFAEKRKRGEIHINFSNEARIGRGKRMGEMVSKTWTGKVWVHHTDLQQTTRIDNEDFPLWEPKGWKKGRKMKFGPVAQLVQSIALTKQGSGVRIPLGSQ